MRRATPSSSATSIALPPARWVDGGAELHVALVPAVPELAEPWFRLAFGHMQLHGIRETGGTGAAPPAGITVRFGTIEDLEGAPELVTQIWDHHTGPSTFTGLTVPPVEEFLADWKTTLETPGVAYFVAERDGRVVGHLLLEPEEPDLARPPGSIYLAVAATLPEARGTGAGVALTDAALAWAARRRLHDRADRLARRQSRVVPLLAAPRLPGDVLPHGPPRQHRLTRGRFDTLPARFRVPRVRFSALGSKAGGGPGCP